MPTNKKRSPLLSAALAIAVNCALGNASTSCDGQHVGAAFSSINILRDIAYGWNVGSDGMMDTLRLDMYQAVGDTERLRPAVVFIHGGGFSEGDKTDAVTVKLCDAFARRGYVTASIDYRLSRQSEIRYNPHAGRNLYRAIYRSVQDTRAAVRYLRSHGTEYGVDTSTIFAGGNSAGGVTAVQYAYMDQGKSVSLIDTAGLGLLDSGFPGVSSRISGIINCWGAIGDTTWIDSGESPVVSVHFRNDPVIPHDIGHVANISAMPVVYGSAAITRAAQRVGVVTWLKTFAGHGHEIRPGGPQMDTAISFISEFLYHRLPCRGEQMRSVSNRE